MPGRRPGPARSQSLRADGTAAARTPVDVRRSREAHYLAVARDDLDGQDWTQRLELHCAGDERPNTDEQQSYRERTVRVLGQMSEQAAGAFVDDRMRAGLGVFSVGSGVARYQNVETQPEFRRRGLATTLLRTAGPYALNELRARTLVIVADPAGVAICLYRPVG